MENAELKNALEALLFITDHPLPLAQLGKLLGVKDAAKVTALVSELRGEYEARGGAVQVLEIAEGFQLASKPALAPFIRKLYADKMAMKLSSAALETLSIVAYKQPLTRAEVEEIRGVEVIAALETLLEKRLVKVVGRKESVGRPLLYGTTPEFLRHFGLKSLSELPSIESFKPAEESAAPAGENAASGEGLDAEGAGAGADGSAEPASEPEGASASSEPPEPVEAGESLEGASDRKPEPEAAQ